MNAKLAEIRHSLCASRAAFFSLLTCAQLCWTTFLIACLVVASSAQALTPAPDGGYPFQNTAEGEDALFKFLLGGYYGNTAVGYHALYSTDRGSYNTAVGNGALSSLHGLLGGNTAVGNLALRDNLAADNTAVGDNALLSNTTGTQNTAFGAVALQQNVTGESNTGIGSQALRLNSGSYNSATGSQALFSNTGGSYNVADGWHALYNNTSASFNTGLGVGALHQNTTGINNTATGVNALFYSNGQNNTADGANSLQRNITGSENTAVGSDAFFGSLDANGMPNSTGSYNTATGFQSLYSNQNGNRNIAIGWQTLYSNKTGSFNTAIGTTALSQNSSGNQNTATGVNALYYNNGSNNTATGLAALQNNTTGSNNVALGYQAGLNFKTGNNNIVIGAGVLGAATDASITRIGKTTQAAAYIGGIYSKGVASATGVPVKIDSTGKLGTVLSSARYKDHIKPMEKASEAILQFEPVTFHYKKELDPDGVAQFGLIAEQVEKVNPDLVVRDEEGKVSTVRYEAVNAMLLNEFLKQHRKVMEQQEAIAALKQKLAYQTARADEHEAAIREQQKRIEVLAAGLKRVSARVETTQTSTKLVKTK